MEFGFQDMKDATITILYLGMDVHQHVLKRATGHVPILHSQFQLVLFVETLISEDQKNAMMETQHQEMDVHIQDAK